MKMGAIRELELPVVARIFQLFEVFLFTTLEIATLPSLPCLGRTKNLFLAYVKSCSLMAPP